MLHNIYLIYALHFFFLSKTFNTVRYSKVGSVVVFTWWGGSGVKPGEMRLKVLSVGGDFGIVWIMDTARCD